MSKQYWAREFCIDHHGNMGYKTFLKESPEHKKTDKEMTKTKLPEIGKRYNFHLKQDQNHPSSSIQIEAELLYFEELPPEKPVVKESSRTEETAQIQLICEKCQKKAADLEAVYLYLGNKLRFAHECMTQEPSKVEVAIEELKNQGLSALEAAIKDDIRSLKKLFSAKFLNEEEMQKNLYEISYHSQKLVDALDEQNKSKTSEEKMWKEKDARDEVFYQKTMQDYIEKRQKLGESIDPKEYHIDEEKPLWKPVSELPETEFCILKDAQDNYTFGHFSSDEENFTEFTGDAVFEDLDPKCPKVIAYATFSDFINDHEKLKERVKRLEGKKN